MPHVIIDILFIVLLFISFIIIYFKIIYPFNKKYRKLKELINKNSKIIENFHKKEEIYEINKSIHLYNKLELILKISKADFCWFFKYDYNEKNIIYSLLLFVENNKEIINYYNLKKTPIYKDEFLVNILNSEGNSLEYKYFKKKLFLFKNTINKIYYKKILINEKNFGFIVLSYKDKDFILSNYEKNEINRITSNIKY